MAMVQPDPKVHPVGVVALAKVSLMSVALPPPRLNEWTVMVRLVEVAVAGETQRSEEGVSTTATVSALARLPLV